MEFEDKDILGCLPEKGLLKVPVNYPSDLVWRETAPCRSVWFDNTLCPSLFWRARLFRFGYFIRLLSQDADGGHELGSVPRGILLAWKTWVDAFNFYFSTSPGRGSPV